MTKSSDLYRNKENIQSAANREKVTFKKPTRMSAEELQEQQAYLAAITSDPLDLSAKEFVRVYESPFNKNNMKTNVKKIYLLRILYKAVNDMMVRVRGIFENRRESYRFILQVYDRMNTTSSFESHKPKDLSEFKFYFHQWFMAVCRALLSVQLLLKGTTSYQDSKKRSKIYRLPSEEDTFAWDRYTTMRSVYHVDTIYNQARAFFKQIGAKKASSKLEDAILNIDNISRQLSEIQTTAVGFFKHVREDMERKTDLEIKEFSVDIHQLMFNGIPIIRLCTVAKKELIYMADQSISGMDLTSLTFEETKKHTIVQDYSKSLETALQVPGTPLPQLPTLRELPTSGEATKRLKRKSTASGEEEEQRSPEFPFSQGENSIQEQEAVYGSNLLSQLSEEGKQQSAFDDVMHPTSEQEQQPLHDVSGTQLSEEEKQSAFGIVPESEEGTAEEEGTAATGKLVIFPTITSSNSVENIIASGGDDEEEEWNEEIVKAQTSPRVITRRSKRLFNVDDDDVEASEEAMRNYKEQPFITTLLNNDMSMEEAINIVKKVVVESIVASSVYEQASTNALHDLIKFALLKQAKDAWKKKDLRMNLAGLLVDIYELSRQGMINAAIAAAKAQGLGRPAKRGKRMIYLDEKMRDKLNTRASRFCCGVACELWETLCNELFTEKPEIMDKLLLVQYGDKVPAIDDTAWQELTQSIKETYFFKGFDIVQLAHQIKAQPVDSSNLERARLVTTFTGFNPSAPENEKVVFERMLQVAYKFSGKKSYAGLTKEPAKKKRQTDEGEQPEAKKKKRKVAINDEEEEAVEKQQDEKVEKQQEEEESLVTTASSPDKSEKIKSLEPHRHHDSDTGEDDRGVLLNKGYAQPASPSLYKGLASRLEVGASFEETMEAIDRCCSNTFDSDGVEFTMYNDWMKNRLNNRTYQAVRDTVVKFMDDEISDQELFGQFKDDVADNIPLLMVVNVPEDALLYEDTPGMGHCYYLLHLQLFLRAKGNYETEMNQLKSLLDLDAPFDERTIALFNVELDNLKSLGEGDLEINDLINAMTKAIAFCSDANNKGKVMLSEGGGWGALSQACRLFFAPEYRYSMAMFTTLKNFFNVKLGNYFPEPLKSKLEGLQRYGVVYVQSTAGLVFQKPGSYAAPFNVLRAGLNHLNAGCFSDDHFYPILLPSNLLQNMEHCFHLFCVNLFTIIKEMNKSEVCNNWVQKFDSYKKARYSGIMKTSPDATSVIELLSPPKQKIPNDMAALSDAAKEEGTSSALLTTSSAWKALMEWKINKEEEKDALSDEISNVVQWLNQLEKDVLGK